MGARGRPPAFAVGFGAALLVRGLVAVSRHDGVRLEETYVGTLAWALVEGLPLDTARLGVIDHNRGSVLLAGLVAPLYALGGPRLALLRLVAVLWSAAAAGVLAHVADRAAGRRAALGVAALVALLPPAYQMLDVLALGSHADAALPIALALAAVACGAGPLGPRRAALLGAAVGFGALFGYQPVVALPALGLALLARDPRFLLRRDAAVAVAAALPLAALAPLLTRTTRIVSKPLAERVLPDGVGGAAEKLGATLAHDLRRSWLFEEHGGGWLGWAWLAAAAAGVVLLVPRVLRREPLAVFALTFPPTLLAAYAASDFRLGFEVPGMAIGSRYLVPLLPVAAVGIALGADELAARGRAAVAAALVLVPAVAGAAGVGALADPGTPWRLPPLRGTAFAFFERHLRHAAADPAERLAWARRVEPDWDADRPLAYGAIAADARRTPARRIAVALAGPPELAPHELVRAGRDHARTAIGRAPLALPPDEPAAWVLRGLGAGIAARAVERTIRLGTVPDHPYRDLLAAPSARRQACAEGAGFHLGLLFTPYHDHYRALVVRAGVDLPAEVAEPFHRGLARGWRHRFLESRFEPPAPGVARIERLVDPRWRPAFRAGLAADAPW